MEKRKLKKNKATTSPTLCTAKGCGQPVPDKRWLLCGNCASEFLTNAALPTGPLLVTFASLRKVVERHEKEDKDYKITLETIKEAYLLDGDIDWHSELVTVQVYVATPRLNWLDDACAELVCWYSQGLAAFAGKEMLTLNWPLRRRGDDIEDDAYDVAYDAYHQTQLSGH